MKCNGQELVLLRPKRVLQVPLIQLLSDARADISWPFSLRSLMLHRPPWILLPNKRYMLGCLCAICQNVLLLLRLVTKINFFSFLAYTRRSINQFIVWHRQYGRSREKIVAIHFEFATSIPAFLDLVLHPKVGDILTSVSFILTIADGWKDVL